MKIYLFFKWQTLQFVRVLILIWCEIFKWKCKIAFCALANSSVLKIHGHCIIHLFLFQRYLLKYYFMTHQSFSYKSINPLNQPNLHYAKSITRLRPHSSISAGVVHMFLWFQIILPLNNGANQSVPIRDSFPLN